MKILICDEEKDCLSSLSAHVREYLNERFLKGSVIAETDPLQIARGSTRYDIAFLEIRMGSMDGITLAKELKQRNEKVALFFVSNHIQYHDEAFDLRAFRFFQKPFEADRLYQSLDRAVQYINDSYLSIILKKAGIHSRIAVDRILYIERENREVAVITEKGKYKVSNSFDELMGRIPNTFFYLVHYSFYMNLHHAARYVYTEVIMDNGDRLPIAPRRRADFHRFWLAYVRRS